MSFISLMLALLLEQARPLGRGNLVHAIARAWVRWSVRNLDAGHPRHAKLAWSVAVIVPAVMSSIAYWFLAWQLGWWAAALWSVLVLYATLGFRQFSFRFTQIRDDLVAGEVEKARKQLADWQEVDLQSLSLIDLPGRVIEFSVLAAHRHVFGVMVWFSLGAVLGLGPAGAVFYRLAEFVGRYWPHQSQRLHQPVSSHLLTQAMSAWQGVDWLPARLTAIGFAVVGNFEEAIDCWRHVSAGVQELTNDVLILAATSGALGFRLPSVALTEETEGGAASGPHLKPQLAHLAAVVGLVWRMVVLWVLLLALLSLARLLG